MANNDGGGTGGGATNSTDANGASANGGGGVRINLVSRSKLEAMSLQEKIRFILDAVKNDQILVLEEGLDPMEEAKLIESTMIEIDPDSFVGIEMESQRDRQATASVIGKLFRRSQYGGRASMTVVGPADKLRTVYKDGATIEAMVLSTPTSNKAPAA